LEKIEMKKTLVAVAALAAVAGAHAEVSITGILDLAYTINDGRSTGTAAKNRTTSLGGQYTGSDLNIGGSEDLGDGLKAKFNLGFAPSPDSANATSGTTATTTGYYGNYVSYVGLSGGFGDLQAGQFFSVLHGTSASYDAADYSQVNTSYQVSQSDSGSAVNGLGQLRANQIQYTLPTLATGLSVKIAKVLGEAAGSGSGNATLWGGQYTVGGFSAGYARDSGNPSASTTNVRNTYGVSYDLGAAKLFLSQQTRKLNTATATDTGTQYGVQVPFGALKVGVQSTSYSTPSIAANTKGAGYNVLVKYDLSKRTSVIGQTGQTKSTAGTSSGSSSATTAVGLWHSF